MNSSSNNFGEGLGILAQLVPSMNKCGMSKKDWAFLAHNPSVQRDLVRHLGTLQKRWVNQDVEGSCFDGDIVQHNDTGHNFGAGFLWDPRHIKLYKPGEIGCGNELTTSLQFISNFVSRERSVVRANVAQWLLEQSSGHEDDNLIPEEWREFTLVFIGNIILKDGKKLFPSLQFKKNSGGQWFPSRVVCDAHLGERDDIRVVFIDVNKT